MPDKLSSKMPLLALAMCLVLGLGLGLGWYLGSGSGGKDNAGSPADSAQGPKTQVADAPKNGMPPARPAKSGSGSAEAQGSDKSGSSMTAGQSVRSGQGGQPGQPGAQTQNQVSGKTTSADAGESAGKAQGPENVQEPETDGDSRHWVEKVLPASEWDLPVSESAADARAAGYSDMVLRGKVKRGDTINSILDKAGGEDFDPFVAAARRVFSLRSFRDGQPYKVITDDGRVKRFEYEIDNRRRLVVEGADSPVARVEAIEYVTMLDSVSAIIDDNLFQAVADIGESPQMAIRLSELFGSEINFVRDLREGDRFSVLVEKRYRNGEYKGYGRILAAHFTCKGKTWEAYLFRDGEGKPQYFNRKGENLRKTLLQSPLAITRVTSRFSRNRRHPILGFSRPHLGVDYGAPTGTPVKAVGDGVVSSRGWNGGYGHQVIIRHGSGLESMYSHLSGYARGIRPGISVRQGQVIAFVGSTGLSTGPHLDFRLRRNGAFINPGKAINPRGEPVSVRRQGAFSQVVQKSLAYMNGKLPLSAYRVNSLVPEAIELSAGPDRARRENSGQIEKAEKTAAKHGRKSRATRKRQASSRSRKAASGGRGEKKGKSR